MGLSFWACCSFEINILWNKKLWELLTKNLRPLRICYKSRREEKHPNLKWFWELSRHFVIIFPGRKPIKSIKYQKFRIRNMYKNCAPWQRGIIITAYRITIVFLFKHVFLLLQFWAISGFQSPEDYLSMRWRERIVE